MMEEKLEQLQGYKGKAGDCVVRSIAIVTNLPYQKIYDDLYKANEEFRTTSRTKLARSLKQKNDSPRSGTHRVVVKKYLEKLGWQWTPTPSFSCLSWCSRL